jgi:hypothetical protein
MRAAQSMLPAGCEYLKYTISPLKGRGSHFGTRWCERLFPMITFIHVVSVVNW